MGLDRVLFIQGEPVSVCQSCSSTTVSAKKKSFPELITAECVSGDGDQFIDHTLMGLVL